MNQLNRRHFMVGASFTALQATRVMGANDRMGVAVIGCGMRGLLGEVLQFSKESNVEVTGVCDIWKQQRETAAERVKKTGAADPKPLAHFEEAIASPAVDAVLISTPDHQHCTQLSAAVRAKKDVYVEKPLAMNMKELLSAVDTVKKSDQYAGWKAYREFSRGPHTQFMAHFVDLVHFVTGAKYPERVTAMGGTFRWKDSRRTAPDSIEVALEYKEGFLVRYNSSFGTNANSFLKFLGTRGTMDATKWSNPWLLTGDGVLGPDRIAAGAKIPEIASTPHMKNWFDCLRSRQQPAAPIETGYGHSVACIMADESFLRGRRMVHDPVKRSIHEG